MTSGACKLHIHTAYIIYSSAIGTYVPAGSVHRYVYVCVCMYVYTILMSHIHVRMIGSYAHS